MRKRIVTAILLPSVILLLSLTGCRKELCYDHDNTVSMSVFSSRQDGTCPGFVTPPSSNSWRKDTASGRRAEWQVCSTG